MDRRRLALTLVLLASGCGDGCGGASSALPVSSSGAAASSRAASSASGAGTPGGSVPADKPSWLGIAADPAAVTKVLNPKGHPPLEGPRATLKGRITMTGDSPPGTTITFPTQCSQADAVYGRLFRVGKDGELADALVAVTGYDAFVPPQAKVAKVQIRGCAFDRRTVAVTYGQRIEVENVDTVESYMPVLDGSPFKAVMVAVPRGAPVPLSPLAPGQYLLRDAMKRPFLLADVFVLKYATAAVSGLDGRYVIEGLPVGKVRVDALLPVLRKTTGKDIELREGDNTLDLVLTYDAKKDRATPVPEPVWGTRVPAPAPSSTPAPTTTPAPTATPAPPPP